MKKIVITKPFMAAPEGHTVITFNPGHQYDLEDFVADKYVALGVAEYQSADEPHNPVKETKVITKLPETKKSKSAK